MKNIEIFFDESGDFIMQTLKNTFVLFLLFSANVNALPIYWEESGHYYDVVQYRADYATAKKMVEMLGNPAVHLAKIDTVEENAFLIQYHPMLRSCNLDQACKATFTHGVWLGGQQTAVNNEPAGNWTWSDGNSLLFSNWKAEEPNNSNGDENCLAMTLSGEWNDQNCGAMLEGFIVEYEIPANEIGYLKTVPLQWRKEMGGNDHWYQRIMVNSITWEDAKNTAAQANLNGAQGHLTTVTSESEHNFLITSFVGQRSNNPCLNPSIQCGLITSRYWLGGQWSWDTALKLTWITGEPAMFTLPFFPASSTDSSFTGIRYLSTLSPGTNWPYPSESTSTMQGYLIEYEANTSATHPLEANDCTVTYVAETGKLSIPCLKVKIGETNPLYYQLQMQQADNFSFNVDWTTLKNWQQP